MFAQRAVRAGTVSQSLRAAYTRASQVMTAVPQLQVPEGQDLPLDEDTRPVIQPQFWRGATGSKCSVSEEAFTIDCRQHAGSASAIAEHYAERMKSSFAKTGLMLLKNTGLEDAEELKVRPVQRRAAGPFWSLTLD